MQGPDRLNGRPIHLIRRFFSVLTARSLNASERGWVRAQLGVAALIELFDQQSGADQRHAYDGARALSNQTNRTDLVVAALMHDVGKRHARLGPVGRSVVTILNALGIPGGQRARAYTAHGPTAAAELAAVGADEVVVAFARHHHGERPASIPAVEWEMLVDVDHRY